MRIRAIVFTNQPDIHGNVISNEALHNIVDFVHDNSPVYLHHKELGGVVGEINDAMFLDGLVQIEGTTNHEWAMELIRKKRFYIVPAYKKTKEGIALARFSFTHLPVEYNPAIEIE